MRGFKQAAKPWQDHGSQRQWLRRVELAFPTRCRRLACAAPKQNNLRLPSMWAWRPWRFLPAPHRAHSHSSLASIGMQVGLFGLGGDGPSEASPTAGLAKPSEDQSTEPPKAFQGKNQGENDTEQRNEITDTGPSAATQVALA